MKPPLAALVLLLTAGAASAQVTPASMKVDANAHHVIVELPDAIKWVPAPASLPAGARVALLEGDPSKPGPFTMQKIVTAATVVEAMARGAATLGF